MLTQRLPSSMQFRIKMQTLALNPLSANCNVLRLPSIQRRTQLRQTRRHGNVVQPHAMVSDGPAYNKYK